MLINFDHLKTFSKALNIKMKGFRGNWNQNDPTADDYIKNRPFYSEGLKETIIIDEVVNFNAGINEAAGPMVYNGFIENSSIKPFTPNQKYTVIWNGKTYDCKAINLDGIGVIGNAYLLGFMGSASEFEDTGEPFFIGIETGFGVFLLSTQAGNVSVVVKSVEEKIHKLDKKFIDMPDGIVTEDTLEENLAPVAFTGNYWDLWDTPMVYDDVVRYNTQSLTDAQKTNARTNIDVYSKDEVYKDYLQLQTIAYKMPFSMQWRSVTYGNGKFVAVASGNNAVVYSEDGITWSSATMPASRVWYSVTYGNGKFVAVAGGSNKAAYSEDGITWTDATMPASRNWQSVTYGNGKFVAIAGSINKAAYSVDGITWIETSMPASRVWYSVTYGNGKFVSVAGSSDKAAYSEDGITWTDATMPSKTFSYYSWKSVTYGNGKFVAITINSNTSAYSEDGITWTETDMPVTKSNNSWSSVVYGNGKFVAVANDNSSAAYSEDGITWTETAMPVAKNWQSVTYGNGKFVAIATNSDVFVTSKDGITWTNVYTFASQNGAEVTAEQLGAISVNEIMTVVEVDAICGAIVYDESEVEF